MYLNSVWSLAEPAYLFNTSFQFPSDWNRTKFIPLIPLEGDLHDTTSLTTVLSHSFPYVLSKVVESIVYKNVACFLHPQTNDVPIRLSYNIAIDHASAKQLLL